VTGRTSTWEAAVLPLRDLRDGGEGTVRVKLVVASSSRGLPIFVS